jgi:phospholipase/lecithinase/hemolysin
MYIEKGPDPSAVHIVFIGTNDLVPILAGATAEQAAAAASAKLETMLGLLADNGVNHLWVATLPDLGDAPLWSMFGLEPLAEVASRAVALLNAEIRRIVDALHVCDARVIELHQVQEQIMANPHQFGFKNVTDACWATDGSVCSDPDTYYWFQASHPSERAHFAWSLAFTREARDFARRCERP